MLSSRSRSWTINNLKRWLSAGLIALALIWTLYPFWWAVALSIKRPPDFFTAKWLPFLQFAPTLDNWRLEWRGFSDPAGLGHGLANSVLVGVSSSLLSITLGALAAFGLLLRMRRRQRIWPLVALYLLPLIVPPVITALPFGMILDGLHMADTRAALIFAHTALILPLAFILVLSGLLDLSPEQMEAAQLDGCSPLKTLVYIALPQLTPLIWGAGVLGFAKSWNEFLYALVNVRITVQTVPLSVASLLNKDGIEFEYVGSHLVLVILPPLLISLFAQKVVARAFSLGSLKD